MTAEPPPPEAPAGKVNLFDRLMGTLKSGNEAQQRQFMRTLSASRPYGGKPDDGGYKGAKLIGLASQMTGEIEHAMPVEFTEYLQETGALHEFTERDFLH